MNEKLLQLIEISRHYGNNPAYILAGGGNTSYKDEEVLYIKASGSSLAEIKTSDLVALSRKKLQIIGKKTYSSNSSERELQVKNDLKSAVLSTENKRPSVETSLHEIINFPFVVHTHPTLINGLLCSCDSEKQVARLFGNQVVYVPYTDPGYVLFKEVARQLDLYRIKNRQDAQIIFLENHGVFVGGNTCDEIISIYEEMEKKIQQEVPLIPTISEIENEDLLCSFSEEIRSVCGNNKIILAAGVDALITPFLTDKEGFLPVSKPFTPDNIVYCKSNYLFVEKNKSISAEIVQFIKQFGYSPKVIALQQQGFLFVDDSMKSVQIVRDVFVDMMKVAFLASALGGARPMSPEQIDFIDNWEVENYRRSMAQ